MPEVGVNSLLPTLFIGFNSIVLPSLLITNAIFVATLDVPKPVFWLVQGMHHVTSDDECSEEKCSISGCVDVGDKVLKKNIETIISYKTCIWMYFFFVSGMSFSVSVSILYVHLYQTRSAGSPQRLDPSCL